MTDFQSEAATPILPTTAALVAYAPDGLIAGFQAVTVAPAAAWEWSPTIPTGGQRYQAGALGYWIEINDATGYSTQATWYVSPATGSDANSGLTSLLPLATFAELEWRLRFARLAQDTTVWLMDSAPATDALRLTAVAANGFKLRVRGVRTVTRTSTITAYAAPVYATNVATLVTDAAVPGGSWTADANRLLTYTTGTAIGFSAWVESDQTANKARTTVQTKTTPGAATYAFAVGTAPTAGDTYTISTVPTITIGTLDVCSQGGTAAASNQLLFDGLEVAFLMAAMPEHAPGFQTYFYECRFDALVACDHFDYLCCNFILGANVRTHRPAFIGCLSRASFAIEASSTQILSHLAVAGQVLVSSAATAVLAGIGIFGVTGDALVIQRGATVFLSGGNGNALYGSGSTLFGVNMHAGSQLIHKSDATLALTGTSGNLAMETATSVKSINTADGTITASTALSWANLAASVGSGGFGGTIVDILSWCKVLIGV